MSRRGNYPISMSWDYYDDSKRGALGLILQSRFVRRVRVADRARS